MAGEPIHGSAVPEVESWLLIENRERWEADIMDCPFPAGVRDWLANVLKKTPRLRAQLIRQPRAEGPLTVLLATTGPHPRIRRWSLTSLEELPSVDVGRVLADTQPTPKDQKPLYLVCTHGKRDRCCALRGVAFWRTLSEQPLDGELWQSSHQGGHRFAATMLYLPLGVQYGRLDPEDAELLVKAHARRELFDLSRYRGQTRLSPPVQSAEAWLREQENELGFDAVEHIGHQLLSEGHWVATFRAAHKLHRVTVKHRTGEYARKLSCDALTSTPPAFHYVIRHEAQTLT